MTSPLPAMKVPTREQWERARNDLVKAARHAHSALIALTDDERNYDLSRALAHFTSTVRSLGLRLSPDEPAAQQPSDLVKRLRHNAEWRSKRTGIQKEKLVEWQAAARIEALEATAAQPSPEIGLYEAIAHGDDIHRAWLKEALENWFAGKPVPPPRSAAAQPEREAALVKAAREVSCIQLPSDWAAIYLRRCLDDLAEALAAYDTPATPDAGREEAK